MERFTVSTDRPTFVELRPRWFSTVPSFLASLCGHLMVVWMLGSLVHQVSLRQSLAVRYPIRALDLSPVPVSWRPPGMANATDSSPSGSSNEPGVRIPAPVGTPGPGTPSTELAAVPKTDAAEGVRAEPQDPAAEPQRKRFQLPPVLVHKPERQVLIQPDLPPDLRVRAKTVVPEVLLWQLPALPKPKPVVVVAAHRAEEPVPQRETPAVIPQLAPRNREQALAEVRHAASPVMPNPPLPLPVTNTTPIRLLDGVAGTRLPAYTAVLVPSPEQLNVISIPDVPVPQARIVVLPPGNQGAPPAPPRNGGEGTGQGASGAGPGASSQVARQPGSGLGGDAGSRSGQPDTSAKGSGGRIGGAEGGRGSGGRVEGTEGGSGSRGSGEGINGGKDGHGSLQAGGTSGHPGEGVSGGQGNTPPPAGATHIMRPKDGKYSVVVLGSSSAYPEAAGVLSGKPVYTVYIRAGARKEWILQYCLPRSAEPAVSVRGSAVPLEAPYPFEIYHPSLTLANDPEYVMVHGFITMAGKFERLTTLGEIDPASSAKLVAALEHWEFRPASRDGEPSAVEILLIIPRDPA